MAAADAPSPTCQDPTLVDLFAQDPATAPHSYAQNVTDLLAALDAAAARTRTRQQALAQRRAQRRGRTRPAADLP